MKPYLVLAVLAAALPLASAVPSNAADLDDDSYLSRPDPRVVRISPPEGRADLRFVRDRDDDSYDDYRSDRRWRPHQRHHDGRIEARASYASDYLPYHVTEWRARRSAIDAWKAKVENIFGPRFAHWRIASDKRVDCDRLRGSVACTVSARPERGEGRWGYWEGRRGYSAE